MKTRQHGFTLWELMVAVAVAAVVLGLAVPSFRQFQRSNAMAAAANDLVTGALLARSEAVKRQVPVTLCTTDDPTEDAPACTAASDGAFVVFVDDDGDGMPDATDGNGAVDAGETVLLRGAGPGSRIQLSMDNHFITYGPNGFPRAASATRFLLCDDRGRGTDVGGQSSARVLIFDPTGRGTVRSDAAIVQATLAALADAECGP